MIVRRTKEFQKLDEKKWIGRMEMIEGPVE